MNALDKILIDFGWALLWLEIAAVLLMIVFVIWWTMKPSLHKNQRHHTKDKTSASRSQHNHSHSEPDKSDLV